ncbi:hypothetical protein AAY473_025034 [Plecturocebus cupreus]
MWINPLRSGVQDWTGQHEETPYLLKIQKLAREKEKERNRKRKKKKNEREKERGRERGRENGILWCPGKPQLSVPSIFCVIRPDEVVFVICEKRLGQLSEGLGQAADHIEALSALNLQVDVTRLEVELLLQAPLGLLQGPVREISLNIVSMISQSIFPTASGSKMLLVSVPITAATLLMIQGAAWVTL